MICSEVSDCLPLGAVIASLNTAGGLPGASVEYALRSEI